MLRKERKREAVRRCRKRKREAALKLEERLKFQRRRQEVLMREVQKQTLLSGGSAEHQLRGARRRACHLARMRPQEHETRCLGAKGGAACLAACLGAVGKRLQQRLLQELCVL